MEMEQMLDGYQSQDSGHPYICQYERPTGNHFAESQDVRTGSRLRKLAYHTHQEGHSDGKGERRESGLISHCPTDKVYPLAQCIEYE